MSEQNTTQEKKKTTIHVKDVTDQMVEYIAIKTLEYTKQRVERLSNCVRDNIPRLLKDKKIECDGHVLEVKISPYSMASIEQIRDKIASILSSRLREQFKTLKSVDATPYIISYWVYTDGFATYLLNAIKLNTNDEQIIIYDVELHSLSL